MAINYALLSQALPGLLNRGVLASALQTNQQRLSALQSAAAQQQAQEQALIQSALQSRALGMQQQSQRRKEGLAGQQLNFQQQQLDEQKRQFDIKTNIAEKIRISEEEGKKEARRKQELFAEAMQSGNRSMMYALDPKQAMKFDEKIIKNQEQDTKRADTVRKEFLKQTEAFDDVSQSYSRIQGIKEVLRDPNNPNKAAADVALIYSMAKMYDPGGRVTEGDFNTIAGLSAVPSQIKILAKRLTVGDQMTDRERDMLLRLADLMYKSSEIGFKHKQAVYQDIATRPTELGSITPDLRTPIVTPDSELSKLQKRKSELEGKL